mmetsp:Transcript_64737/g.89584  ORF Transcript_64737/g.89584 Transcript_64737/m.89584 type:complete len:122 (-) Transcript_64737:178-543(-)
MDESKFLQSIYEEKDTKPIKVKNSPRISEGNLSEIVLEFDADPEILDFDGDFVADRDEELYRAAEIFFEMYFEEDYELYNKKPMNKDLIKYSGTQAKEQVKEAQENGDIQDEWTRYFGITS